MIKIYFFKKDDEFFGISAKGHANYADYGKDIVCSSVSTILQSAFVGISEVLNVATKLKRDDESGFFEFYVQLNSLSENLREKVQVILKTAFVSLEKVRIQFKKYLKMEVVDDV